jgi:hypothetical protein
MQTVKLGLEPDGSDKLTLAGDKMRLVEHDDGSATVTFDDKGTGRSCGECTLCCRLLPVQSLAKPANKRCAHATRKGCSIYPKRPWDCRTWSCRWLSDPLAKDLRRPDRTHYVIDVQYDDLVTRNEETGATQKLSMLQVWVDPNRPDAHRDPALRAYLEAMAKRFGVPAVIRYSTTRGFLLIAPSLNDGQWLERHDSLVMPEASFAAFRTALT